MSLFVFHNADLFFFFLGFLKTGAGGVPTGLAGSADPREAQRVGLPVTHSFSEQPTSQAFLGRAPPEAGAIHQPFSG